MEKRKNRRNHPSVLSSSISRDSKAQKRATLSISNAAAFSEMRLSVIFLCTLHFASKSERDIPLNRDDSEINHLVLVGIYCKKQSLNSTTNIDESSLHSESAFRISKPVLTLDSPPTLLGNPGRRVPGTRIIQRQIIPRFPKGEHRISTKYVGTKTAYTPTKSGSCNASTNGIMLDASPAMQTETEQEKAILDSAFAKRKGGGGANIEDKPAGPATDQSAVWLAKPPQDSKGHTPCPYSPSPRSRC